MTNIENKIKVSKGILIKQEYIFAFIALLFGVLFVFITPPFSGKNEVKHFAIAYAALDGQEVTGSANGEYGFMIPKTILMTNNAFSEATKKNDGILPKDLVDKYSQSKLHPNDKIFFPHNTDNLNPISCLPSITGLIIGKMFNNNAIYLLWSTRIVGLVFYLIIVFFAIRLMPVFKNVILLIALLPSAVYQAGTVNNDLFALSLGLLVIASIFKMAYQYEKASVSLILVLIICAFLLRFTKGSYFLIPLMIFIVPSIKFSNPAIRFGLFAYIILLVFLPLIINTGFISSGTYALSSNNSAFLVDGSQNLALMMSSPFKLLSLLFQNLILQGGNWMKSAVAGFGMNDISPSGFILFIHILIILVVALFNGSKDIVVNNFSKYTTFGIGFISLLMVIAAYLIYASPVGSYRAEGLSGAYFLPVLPLLLIVMYNTSYRNEIFEKYGSLILGLFSIIMLIISAMFIGNNF
jgi:uncharacterized membrane protein